MTTKQYKEYLQLPESRKKVFLSIAKREGMDKDSIYWLELGLAVYNKQVRRAMFESMA